MMYPRLELLRDLLAEDGSIWVTIDDNEAHYLKVVMDEIFGRAQFVAQCLAEAILAREPRGHSQTHHDYVLSTLRNSTAFRRHEIDFPDQRNKPRSIRTQTTIPRGPWRPISDDMRTGLSSPIKCTRLLRQAVRSIDPPTGAVGRCIESEYQKLIATERM